LFQKFIKNIYSTSQSLIFQSNNNPKKKYSIAHINKGKTKSIINKYKDKSECCLMGKFGDKKDGILLLLLLSSLRKEEDKDERQKWRTVWNRRKI